MRLNLAILLLFGMLVFPASMLLAQDVGKPNFDGHDGVEMLNRDKGPSTPGELLEPTKPYSGSLNSASSPKAKVVSKIDSSALKPSLYKQQSAPKNAVKAKEEEESILSFNFLYYLIQKYKLQDIVD